MSALDPETEQTIRSLIVHHGGGLPAAVAALKAVQARYRWVSDARLARTADLLGLDVAELEGLATFYSLIFRHPVGERVLFLCDSISCYLNGAERLHAAVKQALGIDFGQTTPDGRTTLVNICCIGACDRAPAAMCGRRLIGPVDPDNLADLLEAEP